MTDKRTELALAFLPILVEQARDLAEIEYGQLLARAKINNPDSAAVQSAIVRHVGKALDVLRDLLAGDGMPDLSCLVVNKGTGLPGEAYLDAHDLVGVRTLVQSFDWSCAAALAAQAAARRRAAGVASPRKAAPAARAGAAKQSRKRQEAIQRVAEYWLAHKATMPPEIRACREQLVTLVMADQAVEQAFATVLATSPGGAGRRLCE